ncbi:GNAT family N-acetyltransferase [Halomonas sp.]|uniref:GNAT family N-acetyltransferase n=1 Tax=Halomonas sp. TaxID=1486246 RepID=UPI00356A540B
MIRRLAPDDLAAVTRLARGDPTMSAGDTSLARSLSDPDVRVFGIDDLESAQALAGYALVARLPFEAELQAILVMPGWRRQGLGVRLLEVRAGNASALALYHRLGFLEDGCRRGYYPPSTPGAPREDAVLMSRPLS